MLHAVITAPERPIVLWYWFRIDLAGGGSVYYGAAPGAGAGAGSVYAGPPPAFQLTVHEPGFRTPDFAKGAVMYQIFPDRFRRSAKDRATAGLARHHAAGRKDMWLHERWDEPPAHLPAPGRDHYMPLDLFGGDLPGITESLPYLASLGVDLIYLNPVFESYSNHRYNTGDYMSIDPALGTEEDFAELVSEARRLGIGIILDGVFSHTGDDSVYFNRYGRYPGAGACQSQDSPYYSWYDFSDYPGRYRSWWGFDTLPEVDETQPGWIDFVIEGRGSVLRTWVRRGAAGWRLDVADELPDETIERMRRALKDEDPDALLLGEVWEDATTKESYGRGRRYALGAGLDSVMNYPFRSHAAAYLLGRMDAFAFMRFLVGQSQNYPKEMYHALMNLLSSHDVARIRTVLATGLFGEGMSREEQARLSVAPEDDARAEGLVRCAAALQYALPGMPAIYYGDEVGLHGLTDPFNRGTMPAGFARMPGGLRGLYEALGALRGSRQALRTGGAAFYATGGGVIAVLRYCLGGRDAFGAPAPDEVILTVVNPRPEARRIVIDLGAAKECMTPEEIELMRSAGFTRAVRLLRSDAPSCGDVAYSPSGGGVAHSPSDGGGSASWPSGGRDGAAGVVGGDVAHSPSGGDVAHTPSGGDGSISEASGDGDGATDAVGGCYGATDAVGRSCGATDGVSGGCVIPVTDALLDLSVPPRAAEVYEIVAGRPDGCGL
jgi:glycosidase